MSIRTNKLMGIFGRGMVGLGVLLIAFSAFQLWGTGLAEGRAQSDLADDFADLSEAYQRGVGPVSSPEGTTAPETLAAVADALPDEDDDDGATPDRSPTTNPDQNQSSGVAPPIPFDLLPQAGDAMGVLKIPSIDVEKVIIQGVGRDDLRKGPGHYPNTPLPGQAGNASIAGHRTTYGAPFGDIDQLVPGDLIQVETFQGVFDYEVIPQTTEDGESIGHRIVAPTDTFVVEHYGDNRLTLTACHPKYSAQQRIIVQARLVTPEAPVVELPTVATLDTEAIPGEDFSGSDGDDAGTEASVPVQAGSEIPDEGNAMTSNAAALNESLGWHMEELWSVLLWAGLAVAVLSLASVAGKKWIRRRLAYVTSAPIFLVAVWFCFTHLDRMLPAF